jgi:hypothetical protein
MGNEESQNTSPKGGNGNAEDYTGLAKERREEADQKEKYKDVNLDKITPDQRKDLGTLKFIVWSE